MNRAPSPASLLQSGQGERAACRIGAGLVALAIHGAALAYVLRAPQESAPPASPPPAIMIEMAAEAEAVSTETNEISPDNRAAAATRPEIAQKESETTPEAREPETEKEREKEPDPVVRQEEKFEKAETKAEKVEAPLPPKATKKPAPKKKIVRREPRKPSPRTASAQAMRAQAQVRRAERTAASRSSSGYASSATTPAGWRSLALAHLGRYKRYPAGSQAQGVAGVSLRIGPSGNVQSVSLTRSSGYRELDAEALAMARRASPFPAPGAPASLSTTIGFHLH